MKVVVNNEVIELPETTHGRCPRCYSDMTGAEIPEEMKPQCEPGLTHFSRAIPIRSLVLNCVIAHKCPDCSFEWEVPY